MGSYPSKQKRNRKYSDQTYKKLCGKPFKQKTLKKTMFGKKKSHGEKDHKFCPICGTKLHMVDTFCVKCGYSFQARAEKSKKSRKKNITIVIILIIIAYFGLRYANGQTILPNSFADALRTILPI